MYCAHCPHESYDHSKFEWHRIGGEWKMFKASEACNVLIDSTGGEVCPCRKFESREENPEPT